MDITDANVTQEIISEVKQSEQVLPKVFYCIISILGVTGNSVVLVVFYKVKELHVIGHILVGHQSFVDLIASVVIFLRFVPPSIVVTQMSINYPALANITCRLWINGFIYWTLLQISTTNLVFITIERYFALVHPLKYRSKASKKLALAACILAWTAGSSIHMYTPFIYGILKTGYCDHGIKAPCCNRQVADIGSAGGYAIAILILVTTLLLPVAIMFYVYPVIICTLRRENMCLRTNEVTRPSQSCAVDITLKTRNLHPDGNIQNNLRKVQTGRYREKGRRNVLVTLVLVSITFLICWTPDMFVYFHHNVVTRHDWNDAIHQIVILLAASNVCVNPLIYTLKYKNFQKGLKQVFKTKSFPNTSTSSFDI